MEPVTSFSGDYAFLSNFYRADVQLDKKVYPTTEHAFQAAKTLEPGERRMIQLSGTPGIAKRLGRKVKLRKDWENVKLDVMLDLLRQKFQDPHLREKLLSTGDATLIEGNTWGDKFWGAVLTDGKWVGQNHLGKLLMKVRRGLMEEEWGVM